MSEFMPEPSLLLPDKDSLIAALASTEWKSWTHPGPYRVRSNFLISLIDEIENSGKFPYNVDVKILAFERLGIPRLSDKEMSKEGDPLSTLIYNAQNYRRSDMLRAAGFVPFTNEILENAFKTGRKIECRDGTLLTAKQIDGKIYAMQPRKRKYAVSVQGQPVRWS